MSRSCCAFGKLNSRFVFFYFLLSIIIDNFFLIELPPLFYTAKDRSQRWSLLLSDRCAMYKLLSNSYWRRIVSSFSRVCNDTMLCVSPKFIHNNGRYSSRLKLCCSCFTEAKTTSLVQQHISSINTIKNPHTVFSTARTEGRGELSDNCCHVSSLSDLQCMWKVVSKSQPQHWRFLSNSARFCFSRDHRANTQSHTEKVVPPEVCLFFSTSISRGG